jgi:hypothetical protein
LPDAVDQTAAVRAQNPGGAARFVLDFTLRLRFLRGEGGVYTECPIEAVETQLSLSSASRSCVRHILCKGLFQTQSKSLIPLIF